MSLPHAGGPVRDASTVCVIRPGDDGVEVLMVRRSASSVFVGGAYVFPGGALDDVDRSELARSLFGNERMSAWRSAAVRETAEEAGIVVPAGPGQPAIDGGTTGRSLLETLAEGGYRFDESRLAYLSNWVTPRGQPRRFDTRFFVTDAPRDLEAVPDASEVTEAVWVTPRTALANRRQGWAMVTPTVATLQLLCTYDDPAAVVSFARSQKTVPRIESRIVTVRGGSVRLLMPGDAGYEEAGP
jgi:8-oxo-dGTP pyrophosphatase MutT (NUDIX family)